jgi:WD40 repeat protein
MAVTSVLFSNDGKQLYSISLDRFVRVWNASDGKEVRKMGPTDDDLFGMAWTRDGQTLATVGYAGNVTVWNTSVGKARLAQKLKSPAYCITFTPDGKSVVTGHANMTAIVTPLVAPK